MYNDDMACQACGYTWNSDDYYFVANKYICPDCGVDTRNPIPVFYDEQTIYDIKNDIKGMNWLKNVDIKYFLIEKKNREEKLEKMKTGIDFYGRLLGNSDNAQKIMNYCEEHYNTYDISLLDLKFQDLERELELYFPFLNSKRDYAVNYAIFTALRTIAQGQLDELYEAMELREDKGIEKIETK